MNDKTSSTIPSNEQIIDDLTKDLRETCRTDETKKTSTLSDNENANAASDFCPPDMENHNENDSPAEDLPLHESEQELALKDREVTLSEDDKQKLRAEAEVLKNRGNDNFRAGEYSDAEASYTEALQTCPLAFPNDRAILYANRAASRMKHMDNKDSAIEDCTKAIELNPNYVRAYLRRAQLLEAESKLDDALADFKKILELDPSNTEANHATRRLPPLIEEANEKLKAEMLGKLKDLGNLVLKPFGLSTNNFELQKDPNSGGYSVKFNQNSS